MFVARVAVALALASGAWAQQIGQRRGDITIVQCSELTAQLAERHGPIADPSDYIPALQRLLERTLQVDDPQAGVRLNRKTLLLVLSQVPATHDLAQRALEAVRMGAIEVRVQCTVFTRPASAVREDKLADVVPIDEVAAGRLLKAAVAAGGTIQNLRETGAPSLVPFALQARLATARPRPAGDAPTSPRTGPAVQPPTVGGEVRCRALVLGDDEAALSVNLAGTPLPGGEAFVRLKVGAGAMLTFRGVEDANCVWLRLVALRPIEPASLPQSRPLK